MDAPTLFKHKSLAGIQEEDLIEHLMDDPHWRGRVIGLHGIPSDAEPYLRVPLDGLPGQLQSRCLATCGTTRG